jgi:hypothetical protein
LIPKAALILSVRESLDNPVVVILPSESTDNLNLFPVS